MAAAKKTAEKQYEITVETNPNFGGIGPGGVQFAYGKARIYEGRMVEWFKEHPGYKVEEIKETKETAKDPA